MKKNIICFVLLLLTINSCKEEEFSLRIKRIDDYSIKEKKGKTLLPAQREYDFYSIQIIKDYYAVLNYEKNPCMLIYGKHDNKLFQSILLEKDIILPRFIKREAADVDKVFRVLNNNWGKMIEFGSINKKDSFSSKEIKLPDYYFNFGKLPQLSECLVTSSGIYGTVLYPSYPHTFYYFNPDSEVIFGEPYQSIESRLPDKKLAYASHITVNEKVNCIVTASHFTNTIHFYDKDAQLKQVLLFGSGKVLPKLTKGGKFDVENSTKCFIDIKGTLNYIYCLYSGVENVLSVPSQIVILNWKGKHIRTLQLDRALSSFDIDDSDKELIGICRQEEGTEIVSYKL